MMEPSQDFTWEASLEQIAQRFDYPPTPDLAAISPHPAAGRREESSGQPARLAWALLVVALLLLGLLAVPQTRAAVLSFFTRIGAIDIFIDEAAPTTQPATLPPGDPESGTVGHSLALYQLGRSSTLAEARRIAPFLIAVPAELGEPDEVYVHTNIDLPAVTLVWRSADGSTLSLTEIGMPQFAQKTIYQQVQWVTVGDSEAAWLEGPHSLQLLGNRESNQLLIDSNVLIWTAGDITYRLEGDLEPDEARRIAESLVKTGD
jgi:hypothetical protein